ISDSYLLMNESRIKAAILYANYSPNLAYFDDWMDAFHKFGNFNVSPVDICKMSATSKLRNTLNNVDIIVLLHSTNGDTLSYLYPLKNILTDRKVPLVCFVGNEVNLPGSP